MRFDEECICNVKSRTFEKKERDAHGGQPMSLVEAARLRCDRILSKIFSPARLSSGVDAAVTSPSPAMTPSIETAAVANDKLEHNQQRMTSVNKSQEKTQLSGSATSRSTSSVRARKSPKRRHSSQDGRGHET